MTHIQHMRCCTSFVNNPARTMTHAPGHVMTHNPARMMLHLLRPSDNLSGEAGEVGTGLKIQRNLPLQPVRVHVCMCVRACARTREQA